MDLNEYQKLASKTAKFEEYSEIEKLSYLALGINGEAGEVAEKIKKVIRDHKGELSDEKKEQIIFEIGDVLWYLSQLARVLGYSFEDVAKKNIEKLYSRLERGKIHGEGDNR